MRFANVAEVLWQGHDQCASGIRQARRTWCHPAPRRQQCPSSEAGAHL